jgi:hypothetical protein
VRKTTPSIYAVGLHSGVGHTDSARGEYILLSSFLHSHFWCTGSRRHILYIARLRAHGVTTWVAANNPVFLSFWFVKVPESSDSGSFGFPGSSRFSGFRFSFAVSFSFFCFLLFLNVYFNIFKICTKLFLNKFLFLNKLISKHKSFA